MNFPTGFDAIAEWASGNKVPVHEARFRFAQYAVLRAIADSRSLSASLVFKGGNALDFIWEPNRSTKDLDFSARENDLQIPDLKRLLGDSLLRVGRLSKRAFRDDEIRSRASENYADLQATVRKTFIPFEEAFSKIVSFVERLNIPE